MKLAEALALRADQKKRLGSLSERIARYARVQEGEPPAEDPAELLREFTVLADEHEALIVRINGTNLTATLPEGRTLTQAIARRDTLALRIAVVRKLVTAASASEMRGLRTEIRFVSTVDIAAHQREADRLSKEHRELDTALQSVNWSVDLLD